MRSLRLPALILAAATIPCTAARTQEPLPRAPERAVMVFLDCNAPDCDFDHVRREIEWVNWVRDRQDADVHLLVTAEPTGGGGERYTLDYIGLRTSDGVKKSLSYTSDPNATDAEVREALTRTMGLGLIQFVESTPVLPRLRVLYEAPESEMRGLPTTDPWHLWVFEIGTMGSLEGEAQQSSYSLEGSVTANRVAENVKIKIALTGEYDHEKFETTEDTVVSTSEEYTADLLTVWSLSDHWSAGGTVNLNRSTFLNRDLAIIGGPALEFNIFPYRESTRRRLTFMYSPQLARFDYELETVEDKLTEVRPRHVLLVSASVQQPWGQIDGAVEGIQYLDDLKAHRINTFLSFEYRLFRGFNLDLFAQFSRIKDQFFLPKEGLTEEEILLRRRQRETNFLFDVGLGFSYRFGSIFANIVNPRMGGGEEEGEHH